MNARLEANLLSTGLLPLSLQRVTGMRRPIAPSNNDRLRAWDALRPRERDGNAVSDWALLAQRVRAAGVLPAAGPAVTGQGDYTPEELAFAEAYAREAMADALYPSDDMHYGSSRAADLKARGAGAGGSAPYL